MTSRPIRFLSAQDVLQVHRFAMLDQGVAPRLRDAGLLDSALAMPRQMFDGQPLHPDIPSMAAAYAFHVAANHPFEDGNKRAATAAMIQFLSDNAWSFDATADEAEPVILKLAAGQLTKEELTRWVARVCHEKPSLELRDFFLALPVARFGELWNATKESRPSELEASYAEASDAMPLLRELRLQGDALAARVEDAAKLSPAEMAQLDRDICTRYGQAALLQCLFRLAEDMGYEW